MVISPLFGGRTEGDSIRYEQHRTVIDANMLISSAADITMHFADTTNFDVRKPAHLQASVIGEPIG
jgi:hypothetical protein